MKKVCMDGIEPGLFGHGMHLNHMFGCVRFGNTFLLLSLLQRSSRFYDETVLNFCTFLLRPKCSYFFIPSTFWDFETCNILNESLPEQNDIISCLATDLI